MVECVCRYLRCIQNMRLTIVARQPRGIIRYKVDWHLFNLQFIPYKSVVLNRFFRDFGGLIGLLRGFQCRNRKVFSMGKCALDHELQLRSMKQFLSSVLPNRVFLGALFSCKLIKGVVDRPLYRFAIGSLKLITNFHPPTGFHLRAFNPNRFGVL